MKSPEQNENDDRALEKKTVGSTAQIREVVQKVESKIKHATPGKQVRKVLRVLKKKDKEEKKSSRGYWRNITTLKN